MMVEFITAAFSPVNVVFTVLLLLIGLYWITVILGVLDVELFNIEVPDSEIEPGMETGAEAGEAGASFLRSFLQFFYVGEVPTMILVSMLILCLWTFSMLGNYYLNPNGSMLLAMPILLGNLVASLFVMKLFVTPLRKFYAMLNKDYNAPGKIIGRICTVTTTQVSQDKMGQAEVPTRGAPVVLNVLSLDEHIFEKGQEAIVVEKDDAKGTYLIAPVELER